MATTLKCFGCKEKFLKDNMVQIFSITGKSSNWYCNKCANEKEARNRFSDKVCQIFGLKSPGPRIWTERKRLKDDYGYSDDLIVDCLDYIYNVKGMRKLAESLTLVKPEMVNEMFLAKQKREMESNKIAEAAATTKIKHNLVMTEKIKERKKVFLNPDDFLDE